MLTNVVSALTTLMEFVTHTSIEDNTLISEGTAYQIITHVASDPQDTNRQLCSNALIKFTQGYTLPCFNRVMFGNIKETFWASILSFKIYKEI